MKCLILCIGTDKISGDSLGPAVGSLLRDRYRLPYPVFGVEGCCVNGINLPEYRQLLTAHYKDTPVIAVDAAVGDEHEVGTVKYRKGGVKAGGALGRESDYIGDIGILGVVGIKSHDALSTLMATPYSDVIALAERIAASLYEVLTTMERAV